MRKSDRRIYYYRLLNMTIMPYNSIVAAFDFDNTLIDRDSLIPFLIYKEGWCKTGVRLLLLIPNFLQFAIGRLTRQQIKEKILTSFLRGDSFTDVQALGKKYAENKLDDFINPCALECLRLHQSQGHRCVLVSASLELYLKPWAIRYGFEKVIASQLELTEEGMITGKLLGVNCWGPQKLYRLMAYLGSKENYQLYAYGDSQGDDEILQFADFPFYRTFPRFLSG